jgi:peptidoglycan/LPS O-acetylase OafA/YrhL
MSSIQYRPEIDGLRAIAIIPVILFHLNKDLLPGGFVGVDVFFVISGFLITSIILDEYENGVFSFFNFWSRRIRRILPALTAMVLTTLISGYMILYAPDVNDLGNQGIASLLSFSNISHWLTAGNYWGGEAESSPFLHIWSLSVEEQFYLIFPLLIFITLKYFHKWVALVVLFLCLFSVVLFLFGTQTHPSATFYLLPTRAWELGVGALLAILFFNKKLKFNNNSAITAIGFSAVILSYFFSSKDGISPFLIIPVCGAALIIAFGRDDGNIIKMILSASPVIYIGKISYSLYLWHWPILVLSRQLSLKQHTEFNFMSALGITFIISVLSYHFIEVPARQNKKIAPYIIAVLMFGVALSYALKISDISENTSMYNLTEWNGDLYNVNPIREWPEKIKRRMRGVAVLHSDSIDINAYSNEGIEKIYGKPIPEIMVLGDSHALMWARVLDKSAEELKTSITFFSADGTRPFFSIPPRRESKRNPFFSADQKYSFDIARLKFLNERKPKIVVISCRWSNYANKDDMQKINDFIQYIGNLGSRVLLIEDPPELFFGDKNAPQYLSYLGLMPSNGSKQYVHILNSLEYQNSINFLKRLVKNFDYCNLVVTSDIFWANDKAWVIDSHDVLYIDDDHLSYSGALKAKDRIFAALKANL